MKCKIVTGPNNYNLLKIFEREKDDYIIGADIGAHILTNYGINFDLALGDFDSVTKLQLNEIKNHAKEILEYPIKKSSTDTYLAVEEAFRRGFTDITIYGGVGKRVDHTYANLKLLSLGDIKMISDDTVIYTLDPGTYDINNVYKYISFFALEDVKNLTLHNFEYELENYDLTMDDPLCVSNKGRGILSFTEGLLLVIHQNE